MRRFDKGSHFLVSHFLGWGAGRGQVGVKRVRGGGKVGWGGLDVFDKGSHFFGCHTFWGGVGWLVGVRVV